MRTHRPDMHSVIHRPVWPIGVCAGHADMVEWPCPRAVRELIRAHGDGWPLAAHLWGEFEEAAKLLPTMHPVDLRYMTIVRPLEAVEAYMGAPRVFEPWAEVLA